MNERINVTQMKKTAILTVLALFVVSGAAAQSSTGSTLETQYKLFNQDSTITDVSNRGSWSAIYDSRDVIIYQGNSKEEEFLAAPYFNTGTVGEAVDLSNKWVIHDQGKGTRVGILAKQETENGGRPSKFYGDETNTTYDVNDVAATSDQLAYVIENSDTKPDSILFTQAQNNIDVTNSGNTMPNSVNYINYSVDKVIGKNNEFLVITEAFDSGDDSEVIIYNEDLSDRINSVDVPLSTEEVAFSSNYVATIESNEIVVYDRNDGMSEYRTISPKSAEDFGKIALLDSTIISYSNTTLSTIEIDTGQRNDVFNADDLNNYIQARDNQVVYDIGDQAFVDRLSGLAKEGTISEIAKIILVDGLGVSESNYPLTASFLIILATTAGLGRIAGGIGSGLGMLTGIGFSVVGGLLPGWIAFILAILAAAVLARFAGSTTSGRRGA